MVEIIWYAYKSKSDSVQNLVSFLITMDQNKFYYTVYSDIFDYFLGDFFVFFKRFLYD